jgi:hypothetical protein
MAETKGSVESGPRPASRARPAKPETHEGLLRNTVAGGGAYEGFFIGDCDLLRRRATPDIGLLLNSAVLE